MDKKHMDIPSGANIAGAPIEEPNAGTEIPSNEGGSEYIPRHLSEDGGSFREKRAGEGVGVPRGGDYIVQPDGTHIAPNGAVIRNPWSDMPEIKPDNAYTDEQQDQDILIM